MNRKLALTLGLAGAALVIASLTGHPAHQGGPTRVGRLAHATPPAPTSPSAATAPDDHAVARLLPFSPAELTDATHTALTFATAYASNRYDETPQRYLARLAPMTAPALRPIIEQAATDPTVLAERRRHHQICTATAQAEAIRALGPTSVTLLVATAASTTADNPGPMATSSTSAARGTWQEATSYALTLVHPGDRWLVYAIELASTGDSGETGPGAGTP